MAFVRLSNMPTPPKLRVSSIQNMRGGLNLHDLAWQIQADQSPEMKNMWWRDSVLQSRPGITAYNNGLIFAKDESKSARFIGIPAYPHPYNGWYVFLHPSTTGTGREHFVAVASTNIQHYVDIPYDGHAEPTSKGTFFVYNGSLYYKGTGVYVKFTVSDETDGVTGLNLLRTEDVEGFTPTTYINAKKNAGSGGATGSFGGGDAYQPVNRLSPWRSITYNYTGSDDSDSDWFYIPEYCNPMETSNANAIIRVEILTRSGKWVNVRDYDSTPADGIVWNRTLNDAGLSGEEIDYFAVANGVASTGQTYLNFRGLKDLVEAEGDLSAPNNIRITYKVTTVNGTDARNHIDGLMACSLATVYGGGAGLCVVMAGCTSQPNAYFWSGNTNVAMDPTYFPVENYNLAGDVSDPITAFGKQQNMLVIFQERQIGRTVYGTTEIDGRVFITMDYTVINPQIGCDVPNSIQLIENNLVFANTKSGVMFIKDTSSAYENNIVNISLNVEASRNAHGILLDISTAPKAVTSVDDGKRYWLCANDHIWLWDYSLGGSINDAKSLSWYYFDEVKTPACWLGLDREMPVFVGSDGYLREFKTTTVDTNDAETDVWLVKGEDFEKVLTLPIQDFNTYEVLKNVEKTIFVVKSSGDSTTDIEYETDYGTRTDLTPITTHGSKTWVPRDLIKGRSLVFTKFAVTAVRKPRCLHIRHFLVRLRNSSRSEAISFISAQIYYTLQGVDR